MTTTSTLSASADRHAETLRGVRGPVFRPGDAGFAEEVAGFNAAFQPRPSLVVGATTADDVAAAVRYARATGAKARVQATGHGLSSDLAGTVLVTTKRLTGLRIDPRHRTATVGAGVRWKAVVDAAAEHGLAPLCGSSSQVGAVGYTLGGGHGSLGRRYGYAADHVRSLDVVTADGHRRHVDVLHHHDLFWALRGGRDGLAVVTSMTVDLVPVTRLHGGGIFHPGTSAKEVLHAWRTWAPTLPEHVSTSVALLRLPPDPALPEPLRGQFVVHVRFTSTGTAAEADRLLQPVRAAAPVLIDTIGEMPFTAIDSVHADPTRPMPVAQSGTGLRELCAGTLDAVLARADAASGSTLAMVELRLLGGALARQPRVPNAVTGRGAQFSLLGLGVLAGPGAERVPQQLHALTTTVQPWATAGPLNLAGGGDHSALWSAADRARLATVRHRHDPRGTLAP
ncbi:FAD-binding oxidoreductase [Kineococcus rhizosphaerae]|uniref:FAD-binding oxidoreductase n=1 Tax=Kineococcus rhizosphaerae TaxID=559628 RepID=UPI001B80B1AE|nr:FAD-binding oxidoreductase [Kineococcus rhizosphaerae]